MATPLNSASMILRFLTQVSIGPHGTRRGDLLVARQGAIQRYTLDDLKTGSPAFSADFESLNPPESKEAQQGVAPNT